MGGNKLGKPEGLAAKLIPFKVQCREVSTSKQGKTEQLLNNTDYERIHTMATCGDFKVVVFEVFDSTFSAARIHTDGEE